MLDEPTIISSTARLIWESLEEDYGIDPAPVFKELDIDPGRSFRPGSRVALTSMNRLWDSAVDLSGDPLIGLTVGARTMPGDFYVLGHAWLASNTLAGAIRRLCRFRHVVTTLKGELRLDRDNGTYLLVRRYPAHITRPHDAATDAGFAAFVRLCDFLTREPVRPTTVELAVPASEKRPERYGRLFACPVTCGSEIDVLRFAASDLEYPLTGSVPEVARASDRIAERYVASLDRNKVSSAVQQMLVQMLPAGRSDQDTIARLLYRSRSTLQRQLSAEGTNYREILDSTRLELAKQYLRDGQYSQAQVAFMIGFSDQSNFAKAFRRWTGLSPGEYRNAA